MRLCATVPGCWPITFTIFFPKNSNFAVSQQQIPYLWLCECLWLPALGAQRATARMKKQNMNYVRRSNLICSERTADSTVCINTHPKTNLHVAADSMREKKKTLQCKAIKFGDYTE